MDIKTETRFVRTAPDKIRIFATMLKGKGLDRAISELKVSGKAAQKPLIFLMKQAKALLKDKDLKEETFAIKTLMVNEGPKLKRRRIKHKGQATAILKRMSHIVIVLTDNDNSKKQEINSKKMTNIKKDKDIKLAAKGVSNGS